MVAKISVGNSLYGALAYNGEKINEAKGRLLTTNRIYNDGTGTMDIHRAMEDFLGMMPVRSKVEKPVVHISLNPHPDDILTDTELQNIAREYLEKMGFGNQPYLVFKHEDIDRHHLHIVTVRVDENGRSIDTRNNFYRSKQITRELERKYGLHDAERKNRRLDTPLHKVDASAGDVKKQAGNIVKAISGQYRFQTMGEYRALLSLYNMTVEEAHGNVRGCEYHGLVYSVTDDKGNKVGNPFKSSLFGKSVGYEAVQKKFARSKQEIKDRKLADAHEQRELGFRNAMGMYPDVNMHVIGKNEFLQEVQTVCKNNLDKRTAFLCSGDSYALMIMQWAAKEGYEIPKDFGLMGFDDISVLQYISPKLTTVSTNVEGVASTAVVELIQQIESEVYSPKSIYLNHKILDRDTL